MQWQKFKDLDFLVEQNEGAQVAVVFFHGYGADANDLASLRQVYQLNTPVDWYFPQGLLQVPIGPMMTGRAWFELRISDFETPPGVLPKIPIRPADEENLKKVLPWLNHLGKLYDKVIIGGFSQGAILTSHCLYRLDFTPTALVLFSGFLVGDSFFEQLSLERAVPFFQSHGDRDEILAIAGGQKLFQCLQAAGLKGEWRPFSGGHEIPMPVLAASQTFLNSILENQG